jgi:hypothetical protein
MTGELGNDPSWCGAATCCTTAAATAFTDAGEAGVAGAEAGAPLCFLDYDRDGRLDLFVSNYVNFDPVKAPRPGQSAYCRYNDLAVPCGPQGFAGGTNLLYRNRGDGTFEDVSEKSGIANPRGATTAVFIEQGWRPARMYGMASADLNNDGWPDIYVAGYSVEPAVSKQPRWDVSEIAPAGCAFDENGSRCPAWGPAWGTTTGMAGSTWCERIFPTR